MPTRKAVRRSGNGTRRNDDTKTSTQSMSNIKEEDETKKTDDSEEFNSFFGNYLKSPEGTLILIFRPMIL